MSEKVQKRILFYRVIVGFEADGKLTPFDPAPLMNHVDGLPWNSDGVAGRYLRVGNDDDLACWIYQPSATRYRCALSVLRRGAYPQIEREGELLPLPILDGDGLAETTYFVFFADNVLGVAFNHYGPRPSKLCSYLSTKAPPGVRPPQRFEQLIRGNPLESLDNLNNIRLMQLRLRPADIEQLKDVDKNIYEAFDAAFSVGDTDEVEVILRSKSGKKQRPESVGLVRRLFPVIAENAENFRIKGYNPDMRKTDEYDLLNGVVSRYESVRLVDESSRVVAPDSAFEAIETAYSELADELRRAVSVSLAPPPLAAQ